MSRDAKDKTIQSKGKTKCIVWISGSGLLLAFIIGRLVLYFSPPPVGLAVEGIFNNPLVDFMFIGVVMSIVGGAIWFLWGVRLRRRALRIRAKFPSALLLGAQRLTGFNEALRALGVMPARQVGYFVVVADNEGMRLWKGYTNWNLKEFAAFPWGRVKSLDVDYYPLGSRSLPRIIVNLDVENSAVAFPLYLVGSGWKTFSLRGEKEVYTAHAALQSLRSSAATSNA